VRELDVPGLVLQDERAGSLQHAGTAAGEPGGMPARNDTLAASLHPDQSHSVVVDEAVEDADGIAATSHAGHDRIGKPSCLTQANTGLVDCGNWAVSASWPVPSTATSGIYFAKLVRADTGGASHIVFIVRNDASAILDGEGGECTLNGLYLGDRERLIDNHTTIDHAKPHNGSHEVYKGILGGTSRAVFNGKIIVRQDAQKTDAKQTNRALLLTDGATINTKPQLEIFADDVKCTHGAAIGQLDEEAIFYLRARGLTYAEARPWLKAIRAKVVSREMPPSTSS